MGSKHQVAVVAGDGFDLLDLAGPIEVLRTATLLGARPSYEVSVVSRDGKPIRSESGIEISAHSSLSEFTSKRAAPDTLTVIGGRVDSLTSDQLLIDQLRVIAGRGCRVTSVCNGAIVLAAAGLLDGYRATTHWAVCDDLARRHREVAVVPDQIYVHDRTRWTSAGVSAGIDLFLALVEHDHGRELAHQVAGWLVVFVRRPGGQAQFSAQLKAQPARSPELVELQRWLPDHLGDDLTVNALARRARMSPRTFARAFRAETGRTPAAFVQDLRIEAGRRLLETSDLTVSAVGAAVGLNPATMYRAFRSVLGTTPDCYRQHFGRSRTNQPS